MGFEVNGLPVLSNTYGLANYTNTFKNLTGISVLGSGNIIDTGAAALEYNQIGTYTFAHVANGLGTQRSTIAASFLRSPYDSRYGGFGHSVQSNYSGLVIPKEILF